MGVSTDIMDKEKTDHKFRQYMNARRKEGDEIQLALSTALKEVRENYYKQNGFKSSIYLANGYQEFQNTEKWSLDNVGKIIDSVSQILLGRNKNAKDLEKADPGVVKKVADGAAALVANQALIASRVFDAVSSILGSFTVVSESRRVAKQEHFPVLAGLHLFLSISSETYKSKDFFTDQYLNQLNIVYEVHFSDQEAAREGRIDSATQYFDQIVVFNKRLKALNTQLADAATPEEFAKLESFIKGFEKKRDEAQKQLDSINAARNVMLRNALDGNLTARPAGLLSADTLASDAQIEQLLLQAGSWPNAVSYLSSQEGGRANL